MKRDGGPPQATCAACGAGLHGRYCHACGQDHQGRTGLEFLTRDAFAEVFSLEGRTWHTLRDLFARPARLLDAYRQGLGDYYFSPFKLFLVMSAAFFVFVTWVEVPIYQYLPFRTTPPISVTLIERGVEIRGVEYRDVFLQPTGQPAIAEHDEKLAAAEARADSQQKRAIRLYREYNAAFLDMNDFWHEWLPRLLWLLMPTYALLLMLFFPKRRWVEHALFGIWAHCVAFAVLIAIATVNLTGIGLPAAVLFPAYLFFFVLAAAPYYGVSKLQAALRGAGHLAIYALLVWLPVLFAISFAYGSGKTDVGASIMGYEYLEGGGERMQLPPDPTPVPSR